MKAGHPARAWIIRLITLRPNGTTLRNDPLQEPCTLEQVKAALKACQLRVIGEIAIDAQGVAIATVSPE